MKVVVDLTESQYEYCKKIYCGTGTIIDRVADGVPFYEGDEPQRDISKDDAVNHPSHYTDGGIETLDFIVAKKLDYFLGQVCKYISRAGKKDPEKELEDLKKAQFYLNRKIEIMEKGTTE